GVQDSVALLTGWLPGTEIGADDDPDWLTTNVIFWPLWVTTVIVQVSSVAEATGVAATAAQLSSAQTAASPVRSVRLLNNSVCLVVPKSVVATPQTPADARYWVPRTIAI